MPNGNLSICHFGSVIGQFPSVTSYFQCRYRKRSSDRFGGFSSPYLPGVSCRRFENAGASDAPPNSSHKLTNRRSVGPAAEPPRAARNCTASWRVHIAPSESNRQSRHPPCRGEAGAWGGLQLRVGVRRIGPKRDTMSQIRCQPLMRLVTGVRRFSTRF